MGKRLGSYMRPSLTKNKLVLVAIVLGVLLVVALLFATKHSKSASTQLKTSTTQQLISLLNQADLDIVKGNYQEAQVVYSQALAIAKLPMEKAKVYVEQSTHDYNTAHFNEALKNALSAEKISPNKQTATLAAMSAESLGDKQQAVKYYELELERTSDPDKRNNPDDYDALQSKIKDLQK